MPSSRQCRALTGHPGRLRGTVRTDGWQAKATGPYSITLARISASGTKHSSYFPKIR